MLVLLVALLCSSPSMCKEVGVAEMPQEQCATSAIVMLPQWISESPYRGWELKGYKCVSGNYQLKQDL